MKITEDDNPEGSGEGSDSNCCGSGSPLVQPFPMASSASDEAPCCGPRPGPPSSPYERPGYALCYYVDSFVDTAIGPVPKVKTSLGVWDAVGTLRARLGISRDRYRVAPGLYCVGAPGPDSPVLVTANYKLSFDVLRCALGRLDAWLLILDTRGVNVWCAAGKKTFGTEEVVRLVKETGLEQIVSHRQLILPQLGAPGVAAHLVKNGCGFKVIWGPIRAGDLPEFLANGNELPPQMRQLTFSLWERLVLVPVEVSLILKPSLWILAAIFILSGIGPHVFSLSAAWYRGISLAAAYGLGLVAGTIAVPALLPWLPWRSFYLKGLVPGLVFGLAAVWLWRRPFEGLESAAMVLLSVAVSSYAAMNFTGATPFTSPSGVEKEMRLGIPLQSIALLATVIMWISAAF